MVKEQWGYFIKDSHGCFGGSLGLSAKEDGRSLEWYYTADKNASEYYTDKNLALAEIEKLKELNELAKFDLTWELVYANYYDFPHFKRENGFLLPCLIHLSKDIPKGCITKHKKAVKEI
jgi:hypothetical protein